jgi:hypothetical protein
MPLTIDRRRRPPYYYYGDRQAFDAATLSFKAAIEISLGGTISDSSLSASDALIKTLINAGLLEILEDHRSTASSKIHEIYSFQGDFAAFRAKLIYRNVGFLINHNFVIDDFAENAGLAGDGSTKYLATGYVPSTAAVLNSTSMGVWNQSDGAGGGVHLGGITGANTIRIALLAPFVDGKAYSDISDATHGRVSATLASPYQFVSSSRLNASSHILYRNGSAFAENATNGGSLPSHELYMFALNGNGGDTSHVSHRLSFAFIGLGLTAPEMATLYNAILVFQQAMGRV